MAIKKQIKPYRLIGNLNIVNSPDIVYKDSIIFAKFVEKNKCYEEIVSH